MTWFGVVTVLCRPESCEYGDKCLKAHSEEELQDWMMQAEEEKAIRKNIAAQGLMPYTQRLLEEYQASSSDLVSTIHTLTLCCYTVLVHD